MASVKIYDLNKDFDEARKYSEAFLKENGTSDLVVDETILILEALLFKIFEKDEEYVHSNTADGYVKLEGSGRLGETMLKLSFEGKRYGDDIDVIGSNETPEDKILRAYGERIDYSFHTGLNRISIVVKRGTFTRAKKCAIAAASAIVLYAIIWQFMDASIQKSLLENIVLPIETVFGNAVLMVGAPVTFLSLLKNLTDTYILSERKYDLKHLRRSIVSSSFISSVLGVLTALGMVWFARKLADSPERFTEIGLDVSIGEFISNIMPSDIFTPFQTISPFPLIILAVLITYSFMSVGKYFDKLKNAINAAYALFARMLGVAMFTIPVFAFFAVLDILLHSGFVAIQFLVVLIVCVTLSLAVPAAFYAARIKLGGAALRPFVEKLIPLVRENTKLSSAIDAAPFNIRYCAKNFGIDRAWLEHAVPVLAQINRDGNCFLVTLMSILVATVGNDTIDGYDILVISILVFFMSYGSPNQPGSMLIGVTIILMYAESFNLLALAILAEVGYGSIVGIINIIGDIVTVVLDGSPKTEKTD